MASMLLDKPNVLLVLRAWAIDPSEILAPRLLQERVNLKSITLKLLRKLDVIEESYPLYLLGAPSLDNFDAHKLSIFFTLM